MTAKRYRKKPVVIEAVQWDGTVAHAGYITGWIANHGHEVVYCPDMPYIQIKTPEGRVLVSPSDWIIRGVAGEFYPCRADIFAATYEGASFR